jgi:hypothetical protein
MLADDFDFWDVSDDVYNAVRMAEIAAEGAALRVSARAALLHWAALALLGASLLLGIAMLLWLPLRPWSGQAVWVLILGIAAYLAVVAIVYWTHPTPSSPELRKVQRIRHGIAALLVEQQTSRHARRDAVLINTLSDAIKRLDEQVLPALQQLVERRSRLNRELARYERGDLHAPAPDVLDRLRRLHSRLQAAIDVCVQQAANAYATLVGLLQEGDDARMADRAREWADDLLTLYDSLDEVLRGTDDPSSADAGVTDEATSSVPQTPDKPEIVETDDARGRAEPVPSLAPLVEEALRRVNDPARLTGCRLAEQLPQTIATACREQNDGRRGAPTPLEQARALRGILLAALRRLKPDDMVDGRVGGEMLRFQILSDAYVDGKSSRQIMTRYGISESTLHRYRRDGVRVLAQELGEQEELLRRDEPDSAAG